jgi:hypothetical protein
MMIIHGYMFSEIPNNEEGKQLINLMKKYLNKNKYDMRVKGQYLQDHLRKDWRRYSYGQSISDSKCLRVYIKEK